MNGRIVMRFTHEGTLFYMNYENGSISNVVASRYGKEIRESTILEQMKGAFQAWASRRGEESLRRLHVGENINVPNIDKSPANRLQERLREESEQKQVIDDAEVAELIISRFSNLMGDPEKLIGAISAAGYSLTRSQVGTIEKISEELIEKHELQREALTAFELSLIHI